MDTPNKNKWQVRVAALVIFVLGFAAGALALNGYKRWRHGPETSSRQERFRRMLDSLHLNAEQETQVHQILGDTREQLQALRKESEPGVLDIRRQTDEKLQKVLTPEQWKQFQQEREELRGRERRRSDQPSNQAIP
jgi:Spy/CpxP family protein refolding chaperone